MCKIIKLYSIFIKCLGFLACSFISINSYSQCEKNNLVFPSNSTQEGIYKTGGSIESAGHINNKAKFMASDKVRLKSGFSLDAGVEFTANNNGCSYNEANCVETFLTPDSLLKMYTPITYPNGNISFGDDTWIYSNRHINEEVVFSMEQGPGTPYMPANLGSPLPAIHNNFNQREIIYSTFQNGQINGVLYYRYTNATFRNVEAVYLHLDNNNVYTEVLFVSYAEQKHGEVVSILETISYGLLTDFATITWNEDLHNDGCNYLYVNGELYKATNPEVVDIDDETETVLLTYQIVPGTVNACNSPDPFELLKVVSITSLNNCKTVQSNTPFSIEAGKQYCFSDGLKITINEIENNLCCTYCDPFCLCVTNGQISIDMTIDDEKGNSEDRTLITQGETNAQIITHNNWEITLVEYICGNYAGANSLSVNNTNGLLKTCEYVDFRYYQNQPFDLGEMSGEYMVFASDSLNSDSDIMSLIQSKNYLDQSYSYEILSYISYPFKQIAVKLNNERNCNEVTSIVADLQSETLVDYAHYGMQTDNCTDDIWQPLGDLCINSYSSIFYVKVHNPDDLLDLNNTMQATNTTLFNQNEFLPQWFSLRANKHSKGDALQMANYFYETGLFLACEPDIIKLPVE